MKAVSLVLMLSGSLAFADVSGQFVAVASEEGTTPPAGFVSQDLLVNATTDWIAANLVVNLTGGSIYQDPLVAGIGPPSPALVLAIPSTRWDTYVTGSEGLAGGAPSSAGGAVDLGGNPIATFDSSHIDLNWFTTTTNDIGVFSIGRFTFSDDSEGTFLLRLDSVNQRSPFLLSGTIENGVITAIPELGPLSLLAASGTCLALILRRRSPRHR